LDRLQLSDKARARVAEVCVQEIQAALDARVIPSHILLLCSDGSQRLVSLPLERCLRENGADLSPAAETNGQAASLPAHVNGAMPLETTAVDDAILLVLEGTEKPLKTRSIAARGKIACNAWTRKRIAALVQSGRVTRLSGNLYWSAHRTLPSDPDQ
jgi:hypothetical protein